MALDFFRITKGLELDNIQLLEGSGVPGAAGDTSLAPVGSIYTDESNGDLYTKVLAGVGTNKWELLATKTYVDMQIGATISWREPVEVADLVSTSIPAATVNVVDGVTITSGMRVLFPAATTSTDQNVWVASGSTGAWTWTEDTNAESAGDTVYVSQGTSSGKRFTYNGTTWVQTDGTTVDELGFIRSFIGKNAAGSETPNYSSITQITQNANLETVAGELDAAIGADVTTDTIITGGNSANANIQALSSALEGDSLEVTATSVTTLITLDSVVAEMGKWIVRAEQVGTLTNVEAMEIIAVHNGTSVDVTAYAKLKLGSAITGLDFDVTLTGGNTLNLTVMSTAAANVTSKRVSVF